MNIPLLLYIVLLIAGIVTVLLSFLFRGSERYIDIILGFIGIFICFAVALMSISGDVYVSTSDINVGNVFVTYYESITIVPLHYFFLLIGMIVVINTIFSLSEIIINSYKNSIGEEV